MATKAQIADQHRAIEKLRTMLTPGMTVYTTVKHVSQSGMSRSITAYVIIDGEIVSLDYWIDLAGIAKFDQNHGGVKMGGCGMDMGFALVYGLSRRVFADGFPCTGSTGYTPTYKKAKHPRCGSNTHVNGPDAYRRGKMHPADSSGYALHHSWN